MRIAVFTDTFIPQINGIVTSVVNSSKILAEKNHEIHIFSIKLKNHSPINLGKNINISFYRGIQFFNYADFKMVLPKYFNCMKTILNFKPDIIHIHTPTLLGWYGLVIARFLNIPKVGTYHTLLPGFLKHAKFSHMIKNKKAKHIAWKYGNLFYNKCDIVIAPSEIIKKELIKNGLKSKIEVISNGVDLHNFYLKEMRKEVDLLYIGRISYEKNIDVLIRAVKIVSKKIPKINMWIVGRGPDEQKLLKLIRKLHLTKNITLKKAVDNSKLVDYYNKAKIFVSASTIETEGITFLEAMACGLPLLGVNKLAMKDLILQGKNGLKSQVGDPPALAKNIIKLLEDETLRKKMALTSLALSKDFDVHKTVEKLETLYKSLIILKETDSKIHYTSQNHI